MVDVQCRATPGGELAHTSANTARTRLRAVLTGALSVLVVLAAAVYVLAPAGASVRFSVGEVSSAQPFDRDASPRYSLVAARLAKAPAKPKYREVVYGKVDATGVPVSRISLRIAGAERATSGQVATIGIARAGVTYRSLVSLRPGRYQFTLTMTVHGRKKSASAYRTLADRHYYRASATVRANGVLTLLPVSTY